MDRQCQVARLWAHLPSSAVSWYFQFVAAAAQCLLGIVCMDVAAGGGALRYSTVASCGGLRRLPAASSAFIALHTGCYRWLFWPCMCGCAVLTVVATTVEQRTVSWGWQVAVLPCFLMLGYSCFVCDTLSGALCTWCMPWTTSGSLQHAAVCGMSCPLLMTGVHC